MLACDKENLGSAKTIQYFDAELEREFYNEEFDCQEQVYWIDVEVAIQTKKNEFKLYMAN